MKKVISLILVLVMALGLAACNASKSPSEPGEDVYKQDVQEYITEVLNSDGTISSFKKTDSKQKDDTLEVVCEASYGESKGIFTLTYAKDGDGWSLEKCRVQLVDPNAPQDQTEPTTPSQGPDVTEPSQEPDVTEPVNPPVSTKPDDRGYALTQVGTIKDLDRNMMIRNDMLYQVNGEDIKVFDYLGREQKDLQINNGAYLGYGVYAVQSTSGDINSVGLMTQDGKVLIPCEAAKIDWPKSSQSSTDRYLIVTYTTGVTTNADECFIYETDSMISWGPQEGDTMYTGYAKVYDLKNKCFVSNVKITNNDSYAMQPCGDNFFVTDEADVSILYNAKGENVFQTARRVDIADAIFVVYDSGTYRVYDSNGKQTYTSNKSISVIKGNGGYIARYQDDRYMIMDRNGNQVGGMVVENVYSEQDGIFRVKNNGKYGLLHANGTVVLPCDKYTGVNWIGCGIYLADYSVDGGYGYALVDANGVIKDGLPSSGIYDLKIMDGEKAFVINDGDYTLTLEDSYPIKLGMAMIGAESDSNGLYGVFDLFTGKQLLPYEYEKVAAAAGYLYAFKNGEWTVYQIVGPL